MMAFEHFRWDMLWSAITSQMLQLLYQSLITVFGEVHCGLVSQTGVKQGLGLIQNVYPLDVLQNSSWSRTSLISLWEISIWPWMYKLSCIHSIYVKHNEVHSKASNKNLNVLIYVLFIYCMILLSSGSSRLWKLSSIKSHLVRDAVRQNDM